MRVDGWQACAAIVEQGDPDRFASAMAAPVEVRARLFPLYAMNVEVSRAPWVTEEPMIAEMRLQWWRDALEEIAAGEDVRRHEVVTPLAQVLSAEQAVLLDDLVLARRWDAYREAFEDEAAFRAYIDQTAGHLMWVAAQNLGATGEQAVRDIAFGAGVAQFLRAVPELEARGRIPLVDGRAEAVRVLAEGALAQLNRGKRAGVARGARPALWAGWQAEGILKQVVADPRRVADGTLGLSEFTKRVGLMRRALTGAI
ncbi:squalene/phytoene synthase family protein [Primorskyibacter aestuariivivens]|uniref:squalene/phytoene synthase family protein n=1 Tax=Primorskyibacter aestuariivivens TaxID=1888912 RepID=UPI0023009321|nr:squalene/phytoene synthase family protein [Primorskyibacter aestuariivivens]MDA7430735.1 squalene/phytoene synthase family protein [Primorskyibacter aestuariivivens]